MIECLQLGRLSERTQENYVQAVRLLAEHYHKSPGLITEDELRQYFLYLKNVKLGFADPRQQAMLRAYLSEIEFPQDAIVLEVGCGAGAVTHTLAQWPGVPRRQASILRQSLSRGPGRLRKASRTPHSRKGRKHA